MKMQTVWVDGFDPTGKTSFSFSLSQRCVLRNQKLALKPRFIYETRAECIFENISAQVNSNTNIPQNPLHYVQCQPSYRWLYSTCHTVHHNPAELSNAQNHPLILNMPISYQCNPQTVAWSRSSKEKGKSSKMDSYPVMHTCSIVRQGKLKRPCRKECIRKQKLQSKPEGDSRSSISQATSISCSYFAGHFYFLLTALFLEVPYLGPHKFTVSSKILNKRQ